MTSQTLALRTRPDGWWALSRSNLALSLYERKDPTLTVVHCPNPIHDTVADSAKRDRQASLDFLHKLVMG
jgi:hypothetical protein